MRQLEVHLSDPSTPTATAAAFPAIGGEMAWRIREYDWASTPLGPIAQWSESLRALVAMLLESGLPIVLGWGPELICIYNDAYSPLLPAKRKALGRPFHEVWVEAVDAVGPVIERALAGKGSVFENAKFTLARDGRAEDVYFDYCISPVRDVDGTVVGLINHAFETTERVRAGRRQRFHARLDRALRDLTSPRLIMATAARLFGRYLRADRVGYAEPDADERFVRIERDWTNGSMPSAVGRHRVTDFGRELVSGIQAGRAVRVDDALVDPRVGEQDAAAHLALGGLRASLTIPLIRSGRVAAVLYAHQASPRHWTDEEEATAREVAERTRAAIERARAEADLRATSDRLRLILESTTDYAIITTDLDGRVTLWNPGATRLLGWSEQEIVGEPVQRIFTPDERARGVPEAEMECATRTGRAADERPHVRKDGSRFFASGLLMPLRNEFGDMLGFLKILRDRTREHEAEAALERGVAERTAELAAANRQLVNQIEERERVEATLRQMQRLEAVGQLTAGVAHDFNNLLTVIIGNISLLERNLDAPDADPRLLRRLQSVQEAARRGATLTSQLLAFSRRQRLETRAVDLNVTVAGMRDLLQSSMGGSVRLATVLQPDLWLALVDPTQIELVILNLAINARDAMDVGGSLTVETANVTVHEQARRPEEPGPGDYVMISVADNGAGMAPEVLARAFEPFFTTKEVGKGSGLGLAQVYGFVKQSGGGVRIDTRLGEGTVIRIYLPRAADAQVAAEEPEHAQHLGHPPRAALAKQQHILLVDDDRGVREVTAAILAERGYKVTEAGSGGAALDLLDRDQGAIDLILLDYAMPGMNGSELARLARAKRPSMAILFITGYADFAALKEVSEESIVSKPFREEDLLAKVAAALGRAEGAEA
jgi:PAS domain S-box-containing protein